MILETKLNLPKPKAGALLRTELIYLIKNNLDKKLILITADAGYGKTTLLVQLIREARLPVVFYDLDKSDSDLMGFYTYLVNGLKQIDSVLVKYTEELVHQGGEVAKNIELLFGTMINELYKKRKEELYVILDNYQNIVDDSFVHRALDFFIDHLPEKTHVIISSRSVPPLPSIAKWWAKQDLFEITREDLAFTGEETAALLKDVHKTALTEEDVRQVAAHTEGWITGIRLILQSSCSGEKTVQQSISGQMEANKPLFEYFANEILSAEPEETRDFLTKCSILESMTPAACDAILDSTNSEEVLKSLERRHLFITTNVSGEYKCHYLFSEFLQLQLNGEQSALHRKAADYYAQQGSVEPAVDHYLEAKEYGKAGTLICRIAEEMIIKARFKMLDDWLQRIPENAFAERPELYVPIINLRREQGQSDKAGMLYHEAMPLLERAGNAKAVLTLLLGQAVAHWIKCDYTQALGCLQRAKAYLRKDNVSKSIKERMEIDILNLKAVVLMTLGNYKEAEIVLLRVRRIRGLATNKVTQNIVETNLGMVYSSQGDERRARDIYNAIISRIRDIYFYQVGISYFYAATSAIHAGDLITAERMLDTGWALCLPFDDNVSKAYLHYGYGHLYLQKAKWNEALRHFHETAEMAFALGNTNVVCGALRCISRTYRYQGEYSTAQEYIEKAISAIGGKFGEYLVSLQIDQGLLQSCRGEHEQAERTILGCLSQSRKHGWGWAAFLSQLAAAAIYAGQGNTKPAISCLRKAIPIAKSNGCEGILMRELRASPKLSKLAMKLKSDSVYLSRILSECKKYVTGAGDPSLAVQLLGGFELSDGGTGLKTRLKRKATKAILAFFLLHPEKYFTWEEIAAWAWPDSTARAAHTMYNRAIWEIHSCSPVLKSSLQYIGQHYTIQSGSQLQVDAAMFHENLQKAALSNDDAQKTRLLEQAISLYRGPLMPGVYYDWVDELRNMIEEKYAEAIGALAQLYFDKQEYERSALFCHKLLAIEELNEDKHRLLIASYIKLGQKSQALKQYKILVRLLKKNFGTKPSCETDKIITPIIRDTTT